MTTKRHFNKKTLLKKHKKVNLTKKHNKSRLTKSRINKLVGGAPYSTAEINNFERMILNNLRTSDDCEFALMRIEETTTTLESLRAPYRYYPSRKLNTYKNEISKLEELLKINTKNMELLLKKQKEIDRDNLLNRMQSIRKKSTKSASKKNNNSLMNFFNSGVANVDQTEKEIDQTEKKIDHFWFKGWPDHGAPNEYFHNSKFDKFIQSIYNNYRKYGGNTVIHCSAGVGRSGVVYTILYLLFNQDFINMINMMHPMQPIHPIDMSQDDFLKYKNDQLINYILLTIEEGREKRNFFVQSEEQCIFIYNYLYENYMTKSKINPELYKPELIKKYNMIQINEANNRELTDKYTYDKAECSNVKFSSLNRYSNILPYENSRVVLIKNEPTTQCDNYINASNMNPFQLRHNGRVILSQGPKRQTLQDFYLMLWQNNIRRIIMVTDLEEKDKVKCDPYIFGVVDRDLDIDINIMQKMQSASEVIHSILRLEYNPFLELNSQFSLKYVYDHINKNGNEVDEVNNVLRRDPTKIYKPQIQATGAHATGAHATGAHSRSKSLLHPSVPQGSSKKSINLLLNIKKKLFTFLIYKSKAEYKDIVFSFCDCKIILLYILAFNLLPEDKINIIELIKQEPISGSGGPSKENSLLINNTFDKIKNLFKEFNDTELHISTCSNEDITFYLLNPINCFAILFNNLKSTVKKIERIIKNKGIYIKNSANNNLLNNNEELQEIFDISESNA